MCLKATIDEETSWTKIPEGKPKILMISESVPPQVNGIARRIGHYSTGLTGLGYDVDLLCPDNNNSGKVWKHVNPWNFSAMMMVLRPWTFLSLLSTEYDVVHAVMPMNFSGLWLLAGYKLIRTFTQTRTPALVVSWHCNCVDYLSYHMPPILTALALWFFKVVLKVLPEISDRILTPTYATEQTLTKWWRSNELDRTGICHTGKYHEKNSRKKLIGIKYYYLYDRLRKNKLQS